MEDAELISEAIRPVEPTSFDPAAMARCEPGLPQRFTWRSTEYEVAEVLERWKDTGPCHHGSGERYVRKHWYRIRTTDGLEMKLYFERHARSGRKRKRRWWLHSVAGEMPRKRTDQHG
jgi:phosphoribosylglycinamide formyltransferase-1